MPSSQTASLWLYGFVRGYGLGRLRACPLSCSVYLSLRHLCCDLVAGESGYAIKVKGTAISAVVAHAINSRLFA
jgi:hypothetical protein